MWGVFKSVSSTFNQYVWGTEQPPQVPKEPENTIQPATQPRKSSKGPIMHNVPEKVEEDYRMLISAKQLSQGFMIMPVRKDDDAMGKIIFSLGDFLTVAKGIDFVSDKGTIVVRTSDTEITVGGSKKISISQENVKEKLTHLSKLREQSTENLRDLMEHQPSVHVEDPLGAILVSVSDEDKKKEDEKIELEKKVEEQKRQEAKKIEDEKKKAEEQRFIEEKKKREEEEERKKKEAEEKEAAEKKKREEEEKKKKEQEEEKKKEEQKLKEIEDKKKKEAEEQKIKEDAEKKRLAEEQQQLKKQQEAEEQKIKEAAEKKKQEEEQQQRKKQEAEEQQRIKEAAEKKRLEEEEQQRKQQEAEQQRKKQEEEQRNKQEVKQEEPKPEQVAVSQEEVKPVVIDKKQEEQERRRKENQEKLEQERKEEEERRKVMEEQRKKAEEDRAQKKESPAVTQKKLKTGEGCEVCGKRVYPMERFSIGEKAYHQQCFKCAHCNRPLTLGSYSAVDQSLYCKPHFLQLFKEKGTYTTLQSTNSPQMTSKDAESVETKPIVKYATVSTSTVSKELLNELKEDSAPNASQGTIRRTKAAPGRRLPTKKDRSSLTIEKKKEAPIYVIDEATLAAMEEPKELAPLDRPKKINLQDNYDDLPTDPKLRRAEQERRLQEEEDRMRDEKERKRREESQAAFQQMLSPAIKRKGEVIYSKTLIHIKGKRRVRVRRVQLSSTSLNSGDVFVLDCGKKIYVWNGSEANRMEKAKGLDVSQRMAKSTGAKVIVVAEKEENRDLNEFYEEIGGAGEVASAKSAGDDEEYEKEVSKKYQLYKIFNGQPMLIDEKLLKKVLESENTYVLDCETEIYCWIGKKSPKEDRRDAMEIGQQLLQDNPRPEWVYKDVEVKRVVEAGEPILFREKFGDWPDSLPIASQDVSANSNIAVVQKIEKYDVSKIFEMQRKPEEMVDEGGGDKEVWVVNGNTKEAYTDLGIFYSKRCYIILYSYNYRTGPTGNYVKYVLYYWQGVDSAKNDRGASGLLATDIYKDINKNGGEVVMIRVLQNKENQHFKKSYKGKMVTRKGDAPMGVTLFKIREADIESYINAVEVPKAASSLCSRNIFALQTESTVYLWLGKGSTQIERENSEKFVSILCENRQLQVVMETEEPESFWEALGATDKFYANAPYLSTVNWKPRLFCASEGTGVYDIDEVYHFNQEDLVQKYAFILDVYHEVYVWCGHYSSELVKKMTMETALEYVNACVAKDGRPSDVPVYLLYSGEEPIHFTCHFQTWFPANENKESANVLVSEALKNYDKLYTLEELTINCPKFLDKTKLEKYLTDEEFEKAFSMNKDTFATIPLWKAQEIKKKIGLY